MADKKKKKKSKAEQDRTTKIITIVIMTLLMIFVLGHVSAVLNARAAGVDPEPEMAIMEAVQTHIKTQPLRFWEFNLYVDYLGGLVYMLLIICMFNKRNIPQAEMKGTEHGSNDFQSADEKQDFLDNNTSPIMEMDLDMIKKNLADNKF